MEQLTDYLGAMTYWHWFALGAVLLIVEILTPTFFFIWFGIAAVLVGVLHLAVPGTSWQTSLTVFGALSIASTVVWHAAYKKNGGPSPDSDLNQRARRYLGRRAVVDAQVGRRFPEGTAIVLGRLRTMPSGTLVVMHLGNNYYVRPEQVDDVVRRVPAGHRVFLTTVRVNLPWQNSVNGILRDAVRRDPALTLIDWHAASGAPGLLLDGAHTTTRGSRLYARVMADAVRPAS